MKQLNRVHLGVIAALASASLCANAAQPPDSVTSDGSANTAMGSNALLNLPASTQFNFSVQNTAAGFDALVTNTTGAFNSAFGAYVLYGNTTGSDNTAVGDDALAANTSGSDNTVSGYVALAANTTGSGNVASGSNALYHNTTGSYNVAVGYTALLANQSAGFNVAVGSYALFANTAAYNVALGAQALYDNTTGSYNTAMGTYTLMSNTTGSSNTAAGGFALYENSTGANNTAFGYQALFSNSTGKGNAAQGVNALYSNTTGIRNIGIGSDALYANTIGSYNIALGYEAGYNVTTGSNNIEIGTSGTASDNNTIQIGTQGTQIFTAIAGIYGTQITGSAVYVTPTGQLGVQGSSERFKTDIASMPAMSEKLQQLRPVTFHYKTDPKGIRQYGLIAEEVQKVYPELVIHDDSGKIMGVHYEELAPLLLSELQKQQAAVKALSEQNALQAAAMHELERRQQRVDAQAEEISDLRRQVADLGEMRAMLVQLRAKDGFVAQR